MVIDLGRGLADLRILRRAWFTEDGAAVVWLERERRLQESIAGGGRRGSAGVQVGARLHHVAEAITNREVLKHLRDWFRQDKRRGQGRAA
jgi:hypothetical protein